MCSFADRLGHGRQTACLTPPERVSIMMELWTQVAMSLPPKGLVCARIDCFETVEVLLWKVQFSARLCLFLSLSQRHFTLPISIRRLVL